MRPLARLTRPAEVRLIKRFGHSPLAKAFRTPVLVLETIGCRSGMKRCTPLAYSGSEGKTVLVVGGAAGQRTLPDWVANLRANPLASVTIDRRSHNIEAFELEGRERDQNWSTLVKFWPRINKYERRARRLVPVFRFELLEAVNRPPMGQPAEFVQSTET